MTINRTTKIALSLSSLAIAISAGVQAAPQAPGFAAALQAQTSPLPKRYIVKFKTPMQRPLCRPVMCNQWVNSNRVTRQLIRCQAR